MLAKRERNLGSRISLLKEGNRAKATSQGAQVEGLSEARERILREQDGKRSIIVGHGGIFTFTLKDICREVDLAALIASYGHNCSITEIEMQAVDGQLDGVLKRWAAFDHLSGDAAMFVTGHLTVDEAQQG